jgi:hypothetical protein
MVPFCGSGETAGRENRASRQAVERHPAFLVDNTVPLTVCKCLLRRRLRSCKLILSTSYVARPRSRLPIFSLGRLHFAKSET